MHTAATSPRPIHDPRQALQTALQMLELVENSQRHWARAESLRAVGAAYRELGALPSALTMLQAALRWAHALGNRDQAVALTCDIIELLAHQAEEHERERPGSGRQAREQARDLVFEATRHAAGVADPAWEVTLLLRLSDVLDRFGDRDDATQLQIRALQLTVGERPADRRVGGPSPLTH